MLCEDRLAIDWHVQSCTLTSAWCKMPRKLIVSSFRYEHRYRLAHASAMIMTSLPAWCTCTSITVKLQHVHNYTQPVQYTYFYKGVGSGEGEGFMPTQVSSYNYTQKSRCIAYIHERLGRALPQQPDSVGLMARLFYIMAIYTSSGDETAPTWQTCATTCIIALTDNHWIVNLLQGLTPLLRQLLTVPGL